MWRARYVMRVAARKEDDVSALQALCPLIAVDFQSQLSLFDDLHGSDIGEADREAGRWGVRDDALAAQTDAAEEVGQQVLTVAVRAQTESAILHHRRIGKVFRRVGHCLCVVIAIRCEQASSRNWSDARRPSVIVR